MQVIKQWIEKYFSEPEAIFLTVILLVAVAIFAVFGNILVPIIASIVIAYILIGLVDFFVRCKCPYLLAVIIVYLLFIGAFLLFFIWLLPLLFQQLSGLFMEIPRMLGQGQKYLINLQVQHPEIFSAAQLKTILMELSHYLTGAGQILLSFSLASISNVITAVIYLVLVPLLTFFFLKDRNTIITWAKKFLPQEHKTIVRICHEINAKIGDYIHGKLIELLIVAVVSIIVFTILGLNYAVLLGVGVGVSVLIPYVGIIIITIPVVIIGFLAWGFSPHFLYLLIVYAVIATLDANILVPILFSEKMQLHPIVIVLAVLVFGSLWGFWGVFFSIPLATLVDVLMREWPRKFERKK